MKKVNGKKILGIFPDNKKYEEQKKELLLAKANFEKLIRDSE